MAAIAAYAAVTVIPDAFPRIFASPFNVPAAVLLSLCFGLIHGAIRYGIGGIAVFLALCLGISNVMENIGVLTGFPFGHYHYTDVLGPKLFLVPLLIGPAYFGTGYLAGSWRMCCCAQTGGGPGCPPSSFRSLQPSSSSA